MGYKHLEKGYNIFLGVGMLILGIIMFGFFMKDLWVLLQMICKLICKNFYSIAQLILETFLFFEFVVLTQEYFTKPYFIAKFHVYCVTAMLRNLLVYHDDTMGILDSIDLNCHYDTCSSYLSLVTTLLSGFRTRRG